MRGKSSTQQWGLLLRFRPKVRAYIRKLVSDPDLAEDVLQDVSLRALTYEAPVDDHKRFLGWVRGVARFVVAHHARTRRRTISRVSFESDIDDLSAPLADPSDRLEAREQLARTATNIGQADLDLLVRRYVLGDKGVDLAEETASSASALRMRLMRLRSALKEPHRRNGAPRRVSDTYPCR